VGRADLSDSKQVCVHWTGDSENDKPLNCIAPKRSRFLLQHAYDTPPIITIVSAALHCTA